MKRKLLLAALCVVGALGMRAQTDVTSTYLPNADFEATTDDADITKVGSTTLNSRSIKDPASWTVTTSGTYNQYDASVLTSSDVSTLNNSNLTNIYNKTPTLSDTGSKKYGIRFYNGGSTRSLVLSQKSTLPRGVYQLSAELVANNTSNMKTGVYYNSYSTSTSSLKTDLSTANAWTKTSIDFTIIESTPVEVELGVYFTRSTGEAIACADNIKLSYSNYTAELSSMIARAEALGNESLASTISTAQGVLDNADNTVAYQTTIDNAVTTLQAAIIAAQNTNGSALTAAVKNPGFEGAQMWYVKTTGADTYHADAWTNSSPFGSGVYHYSTTTTDQKSEGSQSYKVRFNWADASAELSQTIPGLSLGRYVVTVDVKATNGSQSSIEAYVKGHSTKGESVTAATSGFQTISATVDLNEAGNLDIILGMNYDYTGNGTSGSEAIMYWDNITLTYYSPVDLYNSTKLAAQSTYNNAEYNNVTGDERTALYNLLNPDPAPSTVAEYFQAIDDINDAVAAFTAAKTNYDKYAEEKARAIAMGVASGDITAMTLADQYTTRLQELIVLEDAAVTSGYPEDATEVVGSWTPQNASEKTDAEHWSGESKTYYNYSKWDDGFTSSLSKTVSLPAGSYVLKAAARCYKRNDEGGYYLGVTVDGSSQIKELYTATTGGSGKGIATNGTANYDDGTFANEGTGRGWEWRFVGFTLTEQKDVTLKISANILAQGWVSFSDVTLLTTSDNIDVFEQIYNNAKSAATTAQDNETYANVDGSEKKALDDAIDAAVPEPATLTWYQTQTSTLKSTTATFTSNDVKTAYDNLATAISDANGIVTASTNVGTGVFQVPTTIRETLSGAASTASTKKSDEATTYSDASDAATALNTAISTYNTDFAAAELNAPAEGQRIRIVNCTASSAFDYSGKALTFYANPSQSEGGYGYQYRLDPNNAYAQNFIFTPVAGQKNQYTMSFIDSDGTTRYVCTQYGYNENASGEKTRIRTTTNSEYALKVRVDVTTTANVWKLYNTEAGKNIGTNGKSNSDFFTNADRSDLTLSVAEQATATMSIKADKWGTFIAPFDVTIPENVKAYTVTGVTAENEINYMVKEEVTITIPANTPVVLKNNTGADVSEDFNGWGTAPAVNKTVGLLTGHYDRDYDIPASSYVLQTQGGVQAFYQVESIMSGKGVANRCYLTLPANNANKRNALFFDKEEGTTGLEAPAATSTDDGILYNVAGQQVNASYKGLIIKNRRVMLNK